MIGPLLIKYDPYPTAAKFHASMARVKGIMGPYGGGKSSACVMEIWGRAMMQEPYRGVRRTSWAIIRNTYDQLISTTIKTWKEWFPEVSPDGKQFCKITYSAPPHAKILMPLADGTMLDMEVQFLCLDKPEDVGKFNSLEITGAWINEARYIDMKFVPDILARTGRFPPAKEVRCTWHGIIMDTNPPEVDSDYYKLAEVDRPEGYEFFRQPPALLEVPSSEKEPAHYVPNQGQGAYPAAENIEHLPDGFYYYLDQVSGADREWIRVHLMGEYGTVQYGKPVFGNQFVDSMHVSPVVLEPYSGQMLLVGQDFGFCASVFGQVTNSGQLRLVDEMYADETTGAYQYGRDFLLPRLRGKYAGCPFNVIGDPSGNSRALSNESACMEEFQKLGIPCQEARTNAIAPRLEAVRKLLLAHVSSGQPKFLMSPSCLMLRKAFQKGYHYREINTASGKQTSAMPTKNHPFSDLCLCKGTRITMSDGSEKKVEDVCAGMEVLTPNGPCRVKHAWLVKRDAEVMEVITHSGHSLFATPDHRIWTQNNSWKALDSLEYSDVLLCISITKLVETKIVGKRLCPGRTEVYDLTVEGSHCFYANGILVHNCDCTEYLAMELDGGLTYGGPVGSGQFFSGGRTQARPIVKKSAGAFL